MEVAFWLLLSLGIAIFFWLCWRNIQRSRHERINKVLTLVLTIAALTTGQTAWAESVSYINYNGSSVSVDATPLTGSDLTTDTELIGWYVVKANISYKGRIKLNGDVKIILCDGCTMEIGTSESPISSSECILGGASYSLLIYGQTNQTGALKAYNSSSGYNAVFIQQNYYHYGGNVTIDDSGNNALRVNSTLYLNRGSLNVNCTSTNSPDNVHAIWAYGTNYTGGKLTATSTNGKGINGAVSLSWNNYSESFKFQASSYGSTVTIAAGKTFTDGTNNYSGELISEQITTIANKTLTPIVTIPGISYNSSLDAFEIKDGDDLNTLATYVNSGNNCEGLTFKVTGPIALPHKAANEEGADTENTYTPIGNSSSKPFSGTFDGQGYTISGIRIYSENKNYQGLFGCLQGGTVKNVRLADSRIAAPNNVGGIVGYNDCGTVMNCTVASDVCIHEISTSNRERYHGGIVGQNVSSNSSKKALVKDCTSSAQLTVATNAVGKPVRGGIVGYNYLSYAEVSNCLVLGASVLGWGDSDNCKYLGAIVGNNSSGTLSNNYYSNCTVGNASSPASTNVGVGSDSGKGDVTTNDGARGIGIITLGTGVSMTGGTTVKVGSTTYYYAYYTGNVDPYVITLSHSDAPTGYSFGGYSSSDVTISSSSFTMPATDVTVNATWRKLLTNTDITIADIPAQTYNGSALTPAVTVTDGTTELTKGTNYTISPEDCTNAGDHTITITGIGDYDGNTTKTFTINPKETDYGCITYTETGDAITTTIVLNGDTETSIVAPTGDITGKVTLNRSFTKDTKSTICLPFDVTATNAAALGKFYQFDGLKDGTTDIVKMVEVTTGLVANTPYIFEPKATCASIDFGEQTIAASPSASASTSGTSNEFTFQGTYNYKKWQDGDDELTNGIYGFLAKEWNNHASGYFLKGVANTTIKPFRAYLKYTGTADLTNTDPATNATRGSTRSGSLPEVIEIEWVNAKGETTGIRSIDNGQWIIDNSWYSLDGRRLNGKPTKKGLYINNGKKVVIR